jgi:hypothetical protein
VPLVVATSADALFVVLKIRKSAAGAPAVEFQPTRTGLGDPAARESLWKKATEPVPKVLASTAG